MREALVISFSNLKTDARVKRQVGFLKNQSLKITIACYDAEEDGVLRFIKILPPRLTSLNKLISGFFLLTRFYSKAYWLLYGQRMNADHSFDLIVATDIEALPLAFQLKG